RKFLTSDILALGTPEALPLPSDFATLSRGGATATTIAPAPTEVAGAPATTRIAAVRPNPFVGSAKGLFELARATPVRLTVYDALGRRVRALLDETRAAGRWNVGWDGRDDAGRAVQPGLYFVRFIGDGIVEGRKAILVR